MEWHLEGLGKRTAWEYVIDADGFSIAHVSADRPDAEANARLIAAAPELLEALKVMVEDFAYLCYEKYGQDYVEMGSEIERRARVAIAKATALDNSGQNGTK